MNRRAYLAAVASLGLAGCASSDPPDSSPNESRAANETVEREAVSSTNSESPDGEGSTESDDETGDESDADEEQEEQEPDEPDHPELAGTFDDFEDLSTWTVLEGSFSADESRSLLGSQSALLEAGPSDDRVRIAREFDEPLDCSEVAPGLAVTAEEMVVPLLRFVDADGNRIDYRRAIVGDLPFARYNFGVEDVAGDVDFSAITEIQVLLWTGERSTRFWCDDLHFTPRPDTGTVMIQFDDGYETDYTEALPVLEEYGYPAVTFVNPGRIGNEVRLNLDQARALQNAGWVVASHSHTHPHFPELSAAEQEAEIRRAKEWLETHGFEEGARYFAYPFGGYDATTLELVDAYHELGFAGGRPAQGYAVDPRLCSRIGDPDAERAREALDLAAELRGMTTLFYHELDGQLRDDFEETIAYLHDLESAGDLEVILPADLEEEYLFVE